jgi:hypothetical protein
MAKLNIAAALALTITTSTALAAADCEVGRVRGSLNSGASHPEESVECQMIGRVFCMVEESRINGQPQNYAVKRGTEWLARMEKTGSHHVTDHSRTVEPIAEYVYTHDKMLPWTAYNHAIYSCGFSKQVPQAQAKAFTPRWDAAAADCVKQHPGAGDGTSNQALKDCLDGALRSLVTEAKGAKK